MWREFRKLLSIMVLAAVPVALAAGPGPARAGITTDGKEGKPSLLYRSDLYQSRGAPFLQLSLTAHGNSSGSSSSSDESGPATSGRPPKKPGNGPHHPGDPVMLFGETEWQQIEQGLITEEEAISGCGGAQVAGGNASFGALALAGLFLVLRRRRR